MTNEINPAAAQDMPVEIDGDLAELLQMQEHFVSRLNGLVFDLLSQAQGSDMDRRVPNERAPSSQQLRPRADARPKDSLLQRANVTRKEASSPLAKELPRPINFLIREFMITRPYLLYLLEKQGGEKSPIDATRAEKIPLSQDQKEQLTRVLTSNKLSTTYDRALQNSLLRLERSLEKLENLLLQETKNLPKTSSEKLVQFQQIEKSYRPLRETLLQLLTEKTEQRHFSKSLLQQFTKELRSFFSSVSHFSSKEIDEEIYSPLSRPTNRAFPYLNTKGAFLQSLKEEFSSKELSKREAPLITSSNPTLAKKLATLENPTNIIAPYSAEKKGENRRVKSSFKQEEEDEEEKEEKQDLPYSDQDD